MIWSDNTHKVIAAARFNGSGLVVLVNSRINVTGEICLLVRTYTSSKGNNYVIFQGYTHTTHIYYVNIVRFTIYRSQASKCSEPLSESGSANFFFEMENLNRYGAVLAQCNNCVLIAK